MDSIIAITAVISYCLAIATIIPGLTQQGDIKSNTVMALASIGLILHVFLIWKLVFLGSGQNVSLINILLIISLIVSLAMTGTMARNRLWFILPVVYCSSALTIATATFLPYTLIKHLENDPKLFIHISLALFSYAILTVGALYAVQLAWLDYKLKTKQLLILSRNSPPLMVVERQLFKIIWIGNILLTGTLLTGFVFAHDAIAQGKAHRVVFSLIAWMMFSRLLWGHYKSGWRGKVTVWLTIGGVVLLTLSYFGSRFVQEFLLS